MNNQKTKDKPEATIIEINKPNFALMAKAFINIYEEYGAVTNK